MAGMTRRLAWLCTLLLLDACTAAIPAPVYGPHDSPQVAFAELVEDNPYGIAADQDVLRLPAAAAQLVDDVKRKKRSRQQRVKAIGAMFIQGGVLGMQYETMQTGTAAQTFELRSGNCLAYTHLFIAMARHAGIDARYREVLGVPQWDSVGDYVMLNRHIAAYGELSGGDTYFADFGFLDETERNFGRVISDSRARAQHFNNLGARELVAGNVAAAIRLFARGLTIDTGIGYLWTNLGTAYLRDGDPRRAELALREAVRITPWDVTALNQLTRLYQSLGREELAAYFRQRSESARQQNPYLQFAWAIESRDQGDSAAAIRYLRRAVASSPDEIYFWLELGKTYVLMHDAKGAKAALIQAESMIETAEQQAAFGAAIDELLRLTGTVPETGAPAS